MKADLAQMVKEWLIEEDRFKTEIAKGDVQGTAVRFAYQFDTPGFQHFVLQPEGQQKLLFRSTIQVSEEHHELLYKIMDQAKRTRFLWDLRFGLFWKDTSFQMMPSADDVQFFEFTRVLHEDGGISKAEFETAIAELHKVKLYVTWMLRREQQLAD